jgi:predicted phage gp36 major capsid-like protein
MFDSIKIRQEISTALIPVRNSLAPNVLLRIHPNKVQDLAIADNEGDILILFPTERTTDNDRTFSANHQTRSQRVSVVICLPEYYSETGATRVAERVVNTLERVKVQDALYPLTFDSRREYSQQQRWLLEVNFDIVGRELIRELPEPVQPPITTIRIDIL